MLYCIVFERIRLTLEAMLDDVCVLLLATESI